MLEQGDPVPHVVFRCIDGRSIAYTDIWQRRNLLLVSLPDADGSRRERAVAACLAALAEHRRAIEGYDAAVVVTRDAVPGLPPPSMLVADRWGRIAVVRTARDVASLPDVDEILEWLQFVAHACPECEGEAR